MLCERMEVTAPTFLCLEVPVGIYERMEESIDTIECEKLMAVILGLDAVVGLEGIQGLAVVKGLDASVGVPGPGGDHRDLRVPGGDHQCSRVLRDDRRLCRAPGKDRAHGGPPPGPPQLPDEVGGDSRRLRARGGALRDPRAWTRQGASARARAW
ncbi:unnamed protein product [Prorocentrum cordatum]|uniref:Uncharacterized protein n=1 Tax=Prorocentrum cordatum TaxID=2364126 RepID=A0ABN9R1Y8_9DINO|nr:unnamed protein product [Polarella glacialis]